MRVALIAALVLMPMAAFSQGIEANGWTFTNPTISGPLLGTEGAAPATPAAGKVILYAKTGAPGVFCSKDDAGVETCMATASGGETNTASNLGGGLANWDSKSGVDLRFNSFAAVDFDLATNLLTIDATKWLSITAAAAAYQPLDPDLTDVADGTITSVLGVLAAANTNTTALATTSFVQQEIDDVDLLSDNCVLENDSTPIPDSCVGDGTDGGGGGGGISYADAAAAVLAGF